MRTFEHNVSKTSKLCLKLIKVTIEPSHVKVGHLQMKVQLLLSLLMTNGTVLPRGVVIQFVYYLPEVWC